MTNVINIRDKTGHADEIYIGRGSPFGNPFKIGAKCGLCDSFHTTGGSTLECFTDYFWNKLTTDPLFVQKVRALYGKTLVCFCKPNPCHGDVIAKWVDADYKYYNF